MPTDRPRQAGFTLIEVTIVLAITLLIAAITYKITRACWLLYQTQTHVTERGFSSVRALDDMAVEIARAGYGLGDAGPVFLGRLDGTRASDAITVRSNPDGIAGVLEEELTDPKQPVAVDGAAFFAEGDEVLLVDDQPTLERAQVTAVRPDHLTLRSHDTPDGSFKRPWNARRTRILKVREVGFYLTTDRTGVLAVARKAPGQAEQILVRYVEDLSFEYREGARPANDPRSFLLRRTRSTASSVRITLSLRPNPSLPPITVPPRTVFVSHEPQWATVPFDPAGLHAIGLAGVIGQDPATGAKTVRIHTWHDSTPLF
ncbi:MAG TPA: prepilin-type N-terminal cleavage/methylation domain-containing protein [Vicinamibacteria bacterium]|nr:prepilin-type N-terminal cleavage/methylation domain-containing protein [Vicinamibacteria bacterium]